MITLRCWEVGEFIAVLGGAGRLMNALRYWEVGDYIEVLGGWWIYIGVLGGQWIHWVSARLANALRYWEVGECIEVLRGQWLHWGAGRMVNTLGYWESMKSPHPSPYLVFCISIIWLFLSCTFHNNLVAVSKTVSWVLWVTLANYQTDLLPSVKYVGGLGPVIGVWSEGSNVGLSPQLMECVLTMDN